ncbi:hypothetical protein AMTRI_Chr06g177230 [Amborella trichopoda]
MVMKKRRKKQKVGSQILVLERCSFQKVRRPFKWLSKKKVIEDSLVMRSLPRRNLQQKKMKMLRRLQGEAIEIKSGEGEGPCKACIFLGYEGEVTHKFGDKRRCASPCFWFGPNSDYDKVQLLTAVKASVSLLLKVLAF